MGKTVNLMLREFYLKKKNFFLIVPKHEGKTKGKRLTLSVGVGGSDRYTVQTTVAGLSHQFSHDSQRKTPGNPIDQLGESPIPSDKSKPVSEEKHRSPSAGTQEHCSMEPQSASPVMWRAGSSPVALQQV